MTAIALQNPDIDMNLAPGTGTLKDTVGDCDHHIIQNKAQLKAGPMHFNFAM